MPSLSFSRVSTLLYIAAGLYLTYFARNILHDEGLTLDTPGAAILTMLLFGLFAAGQGLLNRAFGLPEQLDERWNSWELLGRLWVHALVTFVLLDHVALPLAGFQPLSLAAVTAGGWTLGGVVLGQVLCLMVAAAYAAIAVFGARLSVPDQHKSLPWPKLMLYRVPTFLGVALLLYSSVFVALTPI
jgi:hypothetical protein